MNFISFTDWFNNCSVIFMSYPLTLSGLFNETPLGLTGPVLSTVRLLRWSDTLTSFRVRILCVLILERDKCILWSLLLNSDEGQVKALLLGSSYHWSVLLFYITTYYRWESLCASQFSLIIIMLIKIDLLNRHWHTLLANGLIWDEKVTMTSTEQTKFHFELIDLFKRKSRCLW